MPKVVDHAERRLRLVRAVWSLAARDGLEGVTLRKVAAEAGVSMGQVQHYYKSMSELVRDAMDRCGKEINAKIEAALAGIVPVTAEDMLRQCLYAMIRPDEETVRLFRFSLAVVGRSMSDAAMAQLLAPADTELVDFTAGLFTAARAERGLPEGVDVRLDADIAWALAVSLGVDIAMGHRTEDVAERVLDHQLDRLLER